MYYYKITIQYAGTNYAGFQWQNGIHTVQSELNKALAQIMEDTKFSTVAASRTDTGVHARMQLVKITLSRPLDELTFLKQLNAVLPADIKSLNVEECPGSFRPSAEAISKEYRYLFTNKTQVTKEDSKFIANISNKLDFDAINICIQALLGSHDFCNFYSSGSNVKSTVRNIIWCELININPQTIFIGSELFKIPGDLNFCYELRIEANGFLKQMIRHIVSALWMVGSGKLSSNDFLNLLNGPKNNKQNWKVAAPNGLYLYQINY